jgi:hypothetical protein
MWFVFSLLIALAACRCVYLCRAVARDELVSRAGSAWLCRELRRQAHMVQHHDAWGNLSFPQPRETRTLVIKLAGVPVWREVSSVALPHRVEATIDHVTASDFDARFADRFRLVRSTGFELTLA